MKFNVTSTSSIPNELSQVVLEVSAPQSQIFRGPSPTIATIIGIASVFESDYQKEYDKSTGYHLTSQSEVKLGSTFQASQVQITEGLRSSIMIEQLDSGMKTIRAMKSTIFDFVSTISGSVVGILVAVGGVMQSIEMLSWQINHKAQQKKEIRKQDYFKDQLMYLVKSGKIKRFNTLQKQRLSKKQVHPQDVSNIFEKTTFLSLENSPQNIQIKKGKNSDNFFNYSQVASAPLSDQSFSIAINSSVEGIQKISQQTSKKFSTKTNKNSQEKKRINSGNHLSVEDYSES